MKETVEDGTDGDVFVGEIGAEETHSEAVVRAVATVSNARPIDLPPLYERVDPESMDAIFRSDLENGRLRFRYDGYRIVVTSEGKVVVIEDSEDGY